MLKFQAQGFRVFIGKNKEIHILPGGSADVENEGIMARHLRVIDGMDEDLVRLIQLNQK